MNDLQAPIRTAPRRRTSAALTSGVVVATICFVVAGLAELLGVESGSGDMTDLAALLDGLFAFMPWAWASLGTFAVLLTPAIGLLATAVEYGSVADRRTMLSALAVLAVLGASLVIALLR